LQLKEIEDLGVYDLTRTTSRFLLQFVYIIEEDLINLNAFIVVQGTHPRR
jgi:hypothetical protein